MSLTIGRIVLDETIDQIEDTGDTLRISGSVFASDSTSATAQWLQGELRSMVDVLVPVTFAADPAIDGFYYVRGVTVNVVGPPLLQGALQMSLELDRLGNEGRVAFQGRLSGALITNDFSISDAASEPFHAPPRGFDSYYPNLFGISRTGSGGGIFLQRDAVRTAFPTWSISAANYYNGAVTLSTGSPLRVRSGIWTPNTPTSWLIDNELVRVSPNATNPGRLDIAQFDTGGLGWEVAKTWILSDQAEVGQWRYMEIVRNDPEEVIIRLVRPVYGDGNAKRTLDISLRRGSRFASFYFTYSDFQFPLQTIKIRRETNEAGTSGTGFVRATANDAGGNRYVVGSPNTFTADTTIGGLSIASTDHLAFWIGAEANGSSAVAGDQAVDLRNQYLGYISVRELPVIR